jgi:hypothetical protein
MLMKTNLQKIIKIGAIIFVAGFIFFTFNTDKAEAATYACVSVSGATNWNAAASWTGCNSTYPGNTAQ